MFGKCLIKAARDKALLCQRNYNPGSGRLTNSINLKRFRLIALVRLIGLYSEPLGRMVNPSATIGCWGEDSDLSLEQARGSLS